MNPYLQDADLTLYNGDALEVLRGLPDESVHMCVTSPPFYGLRDYGTGRWEGGNPDCDHIREVVGRHYETGANNFDGAGMPRLNKVTATTGWRPSCRCTEGLRPDEFREYGFEPIPCTVLDPFAGSGTTGLVARKHGRRSILIELSPGYCELTAVRTRQLSLLAQEPA